MENTNTAAVQMRKKKKKQQRVFADVTLNPAEILTPTEVLAVNAEKHSVPVKGDAKPSPGLRTAPVQDFVRGKSPEKGKDSEEGKGNTEWQNEWKRKRAPSPPLREHNKGSKIPPSHLRRKVFRPTSKVGRIPTDQWMAYMVQAADPIRQRQVVLSNFSFSLTEDLIRKHCEFLVIGHCPELKDTLQTVEYKNLWDGWEAWILTFSTPKAAILYTQPKKAYMFQGGGSWTAMRWLDMSQDRFLQLYLSGLSVCTTRDFILDFYGRQLGAESITGFHFLTNAGGYFAGEAVISFATPALRNQAYKMGGPPLKWRKIWDVRVEELPHSQHTKPEFQLQLVECKPPFISAKEVRRIFTEAYFGPTQNKNQEEVVVGVHFDIQRGDFTGKCWVIFATPELRNWAQTVPLPPRVPFQRAVAIPTVNG